MFSSQDSHNIAELLYELVAASHELAAEVSVLKIEVRELAKHLEEAIGEKALSR